MNPLITAEEFAGYLQRDLDRYSAELAVRGASGIIRNHCGWNLSRIAETLVVDGNGSASLNLPTVRLNDVTEVRVDGTALDPADYTWGTNGILFRSGSPPYGYWPLGPRRVEVDADHGYDPIPDEIRIVAHAISARFYSNPEGLSAKSSGDGSRTYGAIVLSDLEMRLISNHRL
jgi:hypothetical protein